MKASPRKKENNKQWIVSLWLRRLFSIESHMIQIDAAKVSETIAEMEQKTTAEIRVHASTKRLKAPVMEAAIEKFNELGMFKTQLRNGILIYINSKEKQFSILGDEGINAKVNPDFWEGIKQEMMGLFQQKKHTEAVIMGIHRVGDVLAKEFPLSEQNGSSDNLNPNELSNELSVD